MDRHRILEIATTSIVEKVLKNNDWEPKLDADWLKTQSGAFTTLHSLSPKKQLRGCVGIPNAEYSLGQAIALSARRSATEDPRFLPVKPKEFNDLSISVEILKDFQKMEYSSLSDLYNQIELGKTGLVVEFNNFASLLLPRVAVEQNWTKKDYLEYLCKKAMIPHSFLGTKPLEFSSFVTDFFDSKLSNHFKFDV